MGNGGHVARLSRRCARRGACGAAPAPCVREGCFSLDRDKLLYAILLTDTLEARDSDDMFSDLPMERVARYLEQRLPTLRETVFGLLQAPNEVLCLVLIQSYGRRMILELDSELLDALQPFLLLGMSIAELETITLIEGGQQLALWKFASATNRLHEESRVLAWSALNEYYYFRKRDYSYYLADEARFRAVSMSPGGAGNLRREALRQRDWHAVPAHSVENAVVEVMNFYGSRHFPIYVSLKDPPAQVAFWVEGLSVPFWVVGPRYAVPDERARHGEDALFAEAIAYWIWQFSPSLSPVLAPLAEEHRFVLLRLRLDPDEDWRRMPAPDQVDEATVVQATADPTSATLRHVASRPRRTLRQT